MDSSDSPDSSESTNQDPWNQVERWMLEQSKESMLKLRCETLEAREVEFMLMWNKNTCNPLTRSNDVTKAILDFAENNKADLISKGFVKDLLYHIRTMYELKSLDSSQYTYVLRQVLIQVSGGNASR